MIMRVWRGLTGASKADEYLDYMRRTGINDYLTTPGNKGVYVFKRTEEERVEFLLMTFWDSYDSIKKFAGEEFEKARYYPEDIKYLLSLEPTVKHYDIVMGPKE